MEKFKLEGFIQRYTLGGEIESVIVNSDGSSLSVGMISDDKTLKGDVVLSQAKFPAGEFGIYTTSQLKSLLGVLDQSIEVRANPGALVFSDKVTEMQYMLASPSVIPAVPGLKLTPDFNVTVTIDDDFISKFIKSASALSDSTTFTFVHKNGVGEIVLGYSNINSNRISINVNCKCEGDVDPISFSSKYLKLILAANRGAATSFLKISTQGLAHLSFDDNTYLSNYYLVEIR